MKNKLADLYDLGPPFYGNPPQLLVMQTMKEEIKKEILEELEKDGPSFSSSGGGNGGKKCRHMGIFGPFNG